MKLQLIAMSIDIHSGWVQLICVIAFALVIVQMLQIIARKRSGDAQQKYDEWHADPNNWKLGIFYFNPKDPRIMPPKKIKAMGWTVNFANPVSILIMIVLIAGICVYASSRDAH